ncbi:hypothetical protein EII34_01000 [Arachnia propionica]|uniref:Uncharacterized protein n=1 Tax=Arachnia propionica TaxID=1750 RepID=A0A3P1TCG3_9ACTN|nr:hypothetical protein [Arachnia propionica]MDO5083749.1 hypothetical protein [Arachnia propionica]RRD07099.1 hypothetical protein EII34_01000 [Arachnia propionica]
MGIEVIQQLLEEQLRKQYQGHEPDRDVVAQLKLLMRLCHHLTESGPLPLGHPTVVPLLPNTPSGLYSEIRLFDDRESDDPAAWHELTEGDQPLRAAEGDILISFR